MTVLQTDVLVIGGGATGAGVAWDAALRGFDVDPRRPRRPGRGHERALPRAAALGRALRGQGPARGRGVHRRERDPAQHRRRLHRGHRRLLRHHARSTTPPTPTASSRAAARRGVPCEEIRSGAGAARGAAPEPRDLARRSACPTATIEVWKMVWAMARGAQQHGARVLTYHGVIDHPPRRRRGHGRAPAQRAAPARRPTWRRASRSTRPARGPGRSRTWPASRASASSRAGGS